MKSLFHGSTRLIKGKLIPKTAEDLEEHPSNIIKAVYATDKKEVAIAMAIISLRGVNGASLLDYKKGKPVGKIYIGWPKAKYVYLYTLPEKTFKKSKGVRNQYYSEKPVKPINVERINIKDYLHLIKKATKKETLAWCKKYNLNPKNGAVLKQ